MQVNKVYSNSQHKQSFGTFKPVRPDIMEYFKTDIFHGQKDLIDVFQKTIEETTVKHKKTDYSLVLDKVTNSLTREQHPAIIVYAYTTPIRTFLLDTALYKNESLEMSIIHGIKDVGSLGPDFADKQMIKYSNDVFQNMYGKKS